MIWSKEETLPRHELSRVQTQRLQETIARVYANVPFYQNKFKELGIEPKDIASIDDISKLPFTKKQDLRDNYPFGLFAVKKDSGTIVVNADAKFPKLDYATFAIDAFSKAKKKEFPIDALNVYMLGVTLALDPHFPFTCKEIEEAITMMNAKVAEKNIAVLHQAINDTKANV